MLLRGTRNAQEILFAEDGFALLETFYREAPASAFYNTLAAHVVSSLVRGIPGGRPFRMLEVGAPGPTQARVWVDTASGLIIKAQSGALIMVEVKQLSIAKPPAGVLDLPASCAAVLFPKR